MVFTVQILPDRSGVATAARMWVAVLLLGAGGVLASPRPAASQGTAAPPSRSCVAALPANSLTRVAVFAEAQLRDSTHPALVTGVHNLTQAVAERARRLLGAAPDELLSGEPTITWRDLVRELDVTAYRDGRLAWRVAEPDSAGEDGDEKDGDEEDSDDLDGYAWDDEGSNPGAAAELLARALAAVYAEGYPLPWLDQAAMDSLTFRIALRRPKVLGSGVIKALRARQAFPVFSVAAPVFESVAIVRPLSVTYPPRNESRGVSGTVILYYVIDTLGRADLSTVRDVWTAKRPRPTGEEGRYYREFVAAARSSLAAARFKPARVGGCPVRQLVSQPFSFILPW